MLVVDPILLASHNSKCLYVQVDARGRRIKLLAGEFTVFVLPVGVDLTLEGVYAFCVDCVRWKTVPVVDNSVAEDILCRRGPAETLV